MEGKEMDGRPIRVSYAERPRPDVPSGMVRKPLSRSASRSAPGSAFCSWARLESFS